MNCDEAQRWMPAHLDGELDLARDAEVTAHVQACVACAARLQQQRAWRETLRTKLPRWTPPAGLEEKIRSSLAAAHEAPKPARVHRFPGSAIWLPLSAAAAIALGFVWGERHVTGERVGNELLAAHSFALTHGRLTEVTSTDRHTVKPWLAEHLDFVPPVVDLGASGYPLVGARVDRIDEQPVAALVYQRHKHVITVFVAPSGAVKFAAGNARGFHRIAWVASGFDWAAVSDLASNDLADFTSKLRDAPDAGEAAP